MGQHSTSEPAIEPHTLTHTQALMHTWNDEPCCAGSNQGNSSKHFTGKSARGYRCLKFLVTYFHRRDKKNQFLTFSKAQQPDPIKCTAIYLISWRHSCVCLRLSPSRLSGQYICESVYECECVCMCVCGTTRSVHRRNEIVFVMKPVIGTKHPKTSKWTCV